MRRILVVEDTKARIDRFLEVFPDCTVAETADQALAALRADKFDVVFLDHDLGPGLNGADVAEWMAEYLNEDARPRVIVHSWNVRGSMTIYAILRDADFDVDSWHFDHVHLARVLPDPE